jgi:hypothetical protein
LAARLVPGKVVPNRAAAHVRDLGAQDPMLLRLVVMAPVKARPILPVAIPRLGNVNLAVYGPRERLRRQQPKGRPHSSGAR